MTLTGEPAPVMARMTPVIAASTRLPTSAAKTVLVWRLCWRNW
ncbi:MAG TPA: hypothetical protein VKU77_19705 [Streptosporangiaceae bacterium]|nr:hypothetical protein [Streptosporangiaceae bacterium]